MPDLRAPDRAAPAAGEAARRDAPPILAVEGLRTHFATEDGLVKAVDDVSFHVDAGETLAIVGESGSGKSVTALSIMRLIPTPPGRIVGGSIRFRPGDGGTRDLAQLGEAEMRRIRGNEIGMIFQEPMTSLNPVFTVGDQICEAIRAHLRLGRQVARRRAIELLDRVGIADPHRRVDEYPHRLSGGMRQRVMIGMALACEPDLLIADEPTTALDVTIQAQILQLLQALQSDMGMSVLFISHNLGVVAEIADRVAVMYAGRVVEQADVRSIFHAPKHPYTRGLLASIPRVDAGEGENPAHRLHAIPGTVPSLLDLPDGCAFASRCELAHEPCRLQMPAAEDTGSGHLSRCLRWREL